MIRPIVKDVLFLGQKSELATKEDIVIIDDLVAVGGTIDATAHMIKNIETAISIVSFIDFLANINIFLKTFDQ